MKFNMNEAWREATAMMSGNREVVLIIAAVFFLLPSLALALTMPSMQETLMSAGPQGASNAMLQFYSTWWWLLLLVVVVQVVGYLALLALLRDTSRPTVAEALKAGVGGLLPVIGVYFLILAAMAVLTSVVIGLIALNPTLGFVAGIATSVGIIYALVKLSLAMPVIAIERIHNPVSVIIRCWQLTKGASLRLFLFYLLLMVAYMVISIVAGLIVGAFALFAGTSTVLLVNGIISGILSTAMTVVFIVVIAAIHRQLAGPSAAAVSQTFE